MHTEILKASLLTPGLYGRWGLPRIYWGPPGVGKTARIAQTVNSMGFDCFSIATSNREPSDIAGLPLPQEYTFSPRNQGKVTYSQELKTITVTGNAPPDWAIRAMESERCVIFFDEVGDAPRAVQAALMRVILEGRVGELQLPPTVRFLAAANPSEMATTGFEMGPALAGRFGHENVCYEPGVGAAVSQEDLDNWIEWLGGHGTSESEVDLGKDPEGAEEFVEKQWLEEYARARGEVIGFMKSAVGGTNVLFNLPPSGNPSQSRAWPSQRSWECATRALASSRVHGLSEALADTWMTSHVGAGPIVNFRTFRNEADLPNPREFLESGGKSWRHDSARTDKTMAVLGACSALVAGMKSGDKRTKMVATLWGVMEPIAATDTDVVIPACRVMSKAGLSRTVEATETMGRMFRILKACGAVR